MSNLHVDYLYEKDFDMDAICYKSEPSESIQLLNPRPLKRYRVSLICEKSVTFVAEPLYRNCIREIMPISAS